MIGPDPRIDLCGETVALLPERALFWEREGVLIVADVHFGKAAAFRAAALPLPGGTTSESLARLGRAIERTGARRLLFLGDLLHAKAGRAAPTLAAVAAWRERHPELEILLVRGNHDRGAGDPPGEWHVRCVDEPWREGPFAFRHHPAEDPEGYVLAGHIHPAVQLLGAGRQSETLPAFVFGQGCGLLPAFGGFTGGGRVRPRRGDRVYVLADGEVVEITTG